MPIFKTITGKKPILISAPHVYAHRRPKLNMAYKHGEPLTDTILQEICEKTGAYGIYLTNESDYDPNYHKQNEYKDEVKRIIKEEKIRYFIDIHGLNESHLYDLGIYYPTKFTRSIILANTLQKELGKGKLKGASISIFRFPHRYGETLSEYVASKLRVPAVQVEVAKYIREKKELRDTLIENLSNIISTVLV